LAISAPIPVPYHAQQGIPLALMGGCHFGDELRLDQIAKVSLSSFIET